MSPKAARAVRSNVATYVDLQDSRRPANAPKCTPARLLTRTGRHVGTLVSIVLLWYSCAPRQPQLMLSDVCCKGQWQLTGTRAPQSFQANAVRCTAQLLGQPWHSTAKDWLCWRGRIHAPSRCARSRSDYCLSSSFLTRYRPSIAPQQ